MLKTENGPFLYQFAKGAATLSFTPIADRGALVRRIAISAPSNIDTWVVSSKAKEIMRFRIRNGGNQNLLRGDDVAAMPHDTWFDFCRAILGMDPSIPVPLGQTLTIASVGGGTANIMIEFEEHDTSDLSPGMLNHPDGKEWLVPVTVFNSTLVAAAGVVPDNVQVSPGWFPNFFLGIVGTSAWKTQILAMFQEGQGVNTFSGAANHQSTTNTRQLTLNSRLLNSRTTLGIPNLGVASAAGSANTAFGQALAIQNAFERAGNGYENVFNQPIQIGNGDTFQTATEIVGDVTGGADYTGASGIFICRISEVQ